MSDEQKATSSPIIIAQQQSSSGQNAPTAAKATVQKDPSACRMYQAKYPEVDELVMVNVNQIAEMGAYVTLMEYNNIEGMILLSELSKRRIRSVQKLIRVGRHEIAVVLRVDKEKGYIDLSKKRVSPEDVIRCEERYNKSKTVHSILRHVAEKKSIPLEDLYTSFGWPLYAKYGHAFDAFKIALTDPEQIFDSLPEALPGDLKSELLANICRRMTPQKVKIRADIEVVCFEYAGIEAIKSALKAGEAFSSEEVPIKIKLVAPPLYVIITQSSDKTLAIETLERSIGAIEEVIRGQGGEIAVKMRPKVVSETDDQELDALMKKSEMENAEVSGDDNSSDEE